ncbi:MAG: hypothetical protein V3R88_12335, partial [Alphaproteobacteria bacterium]
MSRRADINSTLIVGAGPAVNDAPSGLAGTALELRDQSVVFGVRADPEPDDGFVLNDIEGAVTAADANGVDRVDLIQTFESQARMTRVLQPQLVRLSRLS